MTSSVPWLVVFRHGQTDYNRERRFQGQAQIPLNELGKSQARRTAELTANILEKFLRQGAVLETFLSSDLNRALDTATTVEETFRARLQTHLSFQSTTALREFHCGDLMHHTAVEFEKINPVAFAQYKRDLETDPYTARHPGPDSENRLMMFERLAPLVRALNANFEFFSIDAQKHVHVWSTHGGVIDSLFELLHDPLELDHVVGNGDVVVMHPQERITTTSKGIKLNKRALQFGCDVAWSLHSHYQVGDSISARIQPR